MGETDRKDGVKVEGAVAVQKKFNRWQKRQQHVENKMLKDYRAPMPGLKKELFTVRAASDAADFEEVRKKLARYAGVNFKQGATMAQKAIEKMTSPSFVDPADPDVSASQVEIEKWKVCYNELQNEKKAWKDAGPRVYQLILVHCATQIWSRSLWHLTSTQG